MNLDFVSIPMALSATAPAIFALNSQGTGPGAILISNMDLFAQPAGSVPGRSSQPVSRGQFISVYATGLGALTTTPPPDGSPPASQMTIAATATVSIGGVTVTPSFAGLAPGFVGLYQVDAQVPASVTPGSAVPVSIYRGRRGFEHGHDCGPVVLQYEAKARRPISAHLFLLDRVAVVTIHRSGREKQQGNSVALRLD
jgi:uncharacterized protein (TIGR03437 family)